MLAGNNDVVCCLKRGKGRVIRRAGNTQAREGSKRNAIATFMFGIIRLRSTTAPYELRFSAGIRRCLFLESKGQHETSHPLHA